MKSCVGSRIRGYEGVRFKIDITDFDFNDNVMSESDTDSNESLVFNFEEEDYNGEN